MSPGIGADPRGAGPACTRVRTLIARHQGLILVLWTLLLLCPPAGVAEVVLRVAAPYRIDYYTGAFVSKRLIRFPFGDMPCNAQGYPDRDWIDQDTRPRIGFWGDSITGGVGAGFGHRYTDIISSRRPDRDDRNFGGVGEDGIADAAAADKIIEAQVCEHQQAAGNQQHKQRGRTHAFLPRAGMLRVRQGIPRGFRCLVRQSTAYWRRRITQVARP